MTTLSTLVRVCIWDLGITKTRILERPGSLSFALWIVANLLCYCLCLFDAIVELHAMNENTFNPFPTENESGIYK